MALYSLLTYFIKRVREMRKFLVASHATMAKKRTKSVMHECRVVVL